MNSKTLIKFFPLGIVLMGCVAYSSWGGLGIFSTFLSWVINFLVIFALLVFRRYCKNQLWIDKGSLNLLGIYFLYLSIQIIRGIFVADNYWDFKNLITGSMALSLPLFIYAFSDVSTLTNVLSKWLRWALPVFAIAIWFLPRGAYHFCLGPLFLLGCFLPLCPKRWKLILGTLLAVMLIVDLDARSQVIKSFMVLLCCFACIFHKFISERLLKILHWICYGVALLLLIVGITGTFNIFEELSSNEGKYTSTKIVDGKAKEVDLSSDTRTFIYVEVIESALNHDYVFFGRSPARGNDSNAFGAFSAEELNTGRYERYANELCHPNVFTWIGIIGTVLYSLIYLRGSYLAVYKSNNFYVELLGVLVAFRWIYGWIEDINKFDISNVGLWMMIAVCFSKSFRNMSNKDFLHWIRTIFYTKRHYNATQRNTQLV